MKTASRTLVKSQPELWGLIDQPSRMQGLMCALLGRPAEVAVNQREPESILCWEAEGEDAWIKVELAEKGWGTYVEVSAENTTEPVRLDGWLDAVLDELATPQKRPFKGMETPPAQEPLAEAEPELQAGAPAPAEEAPVEPAPVEPEPVEPERVEPDRVEPAPVEPAPSETATEATPPRKKRRRFFGL